MDCIEIKNLEIFANHGVLSEENSLGQKFLVTLKLFFDLDKAGKMDDIKLTVNYVDICNLVTEYMKKNTFKLIESAARNVIYKIMMEYKLVNGIEIEIKKPWAPIKLSLETVAVKMSRFRKSVYISLGSNVGDKKKYLLGAIEKLNNIEGCEIEKISDMIVTKPYGKIEQGDFLNCVLELKTILLPHELLDCLHKIENEAGRKRDIRWGPRTLDLDILLYGNEIIDDEYIHIPHIDMQNRDFVLRPLSQISPFKRHPILNLTVSQLLEELELRNKK